MPRALAIRYVSVAEGERAGYLARVQERVASAKANGVHMWAFEQVGAGGRFVEFLESADRGTLGTALLQDELFRESLDFRLPPAADESGGWEYFVGLAGAS